MTRVRTLFACALLAIFVAYPIAQAEASPTLGMLAKINDLRRSHGLRQLQVSPSLMHSAHRYSSLMMARQYFGHASRIEASAKYQRLGEIIEIHRGTGPSLSLTYSDWLHSPEHLAVMLDPWFTYIGGGYTTGQFQGRRQTIWVVHFGKL